MQNALKRMVLACSVMLVSILALSPPANAQTPLKKVRIGVATQVINASYFWLTIPIAMNYWRQEGLDVELLPISGSQEAVQQLVAGNLDFAEAGANIVVQANATNNVPLRVVMNNTVLGWYVSTLDGSPYNSLRDLKGKNIGIISLSSSGVPMLKSFARELGMDPESDLNIIPVGAGAPALLALQSNRVQALMFWAAATAGFVDAGAKLKSFANPEWAKLPDFSLITLQKTIDQNPAVVEGLVRGAAKGTVFAVASPTCARKTHWGRFPDTKPTGAPVPVLAQRDLSQLDAQLDSVKAAYAANGGRLWGEATAQSMARLQDFMFDTKQISHKVDASGLIIGGTEFFTRANSFDLKAVQLQATNCASKEL